MTDEVGTAFDGAPLKIIRKTGDEKFRNGSTACDFDLRRFWQWSASDLVGNTARGVLAEYIVAQALGVADGVRNDWRAFDLETPEGVKVEVKSAATVTRSFNSALRGGARGMLKQVS